MPRFPSPVATVGSMQTVDILNAIRDEIGGDYSSMVSNALSVGTVMPNGRTATYNDALTALRGIGETINNYQPLQNAFLSALVNRIGRVVITSKLYENPWAGLKKGILEYGESMEEIFVGLAKPYQFDPIKAEDRVFRRRIPDVQATFHTMNYQKFYPTTVSQEQLSQAFLSFEGVTELISRIIEQVVTGANYDEFLVMKYLIAKVALGGGIYSVTVPVVTADNARTVTTQMVSYAKKLTYMKSDYNARGVKTHTKIDELYTILTSDISSLFDVEVLALSFNMSKAELLGRQIEVDGFGEFDTDRLALIFEDDPYTIYEPFTSAELEELEKIQGLMIDKNWFMIYDNLAGYMTQIYNPEGLNWNYFYHTWKTFSVSPFSNAVLFTSGTPTITSVNVTPDTATVSRGAEMQFTAIVEASGLASKNVIWTIEGDSSVTSTIDSTGKLIVSGGEESTELEITATSIVDGTKSDTAVVTIM